MIATWLAGKLSGLIIFLIACLSIILVPVSAIQTVRLNGISVFGWYAVHGYKPMWEADERDLVTLRDNQQTLKTGLNACNAGVDATKAAGNAMRDAANALIAAAAANANSLKGNIAAIAAVKASPTETCPVADSIIKKGFQ